MVVIFFERKKDGVQCKFYIDGKLQNTLDMAKNRVLKKNWDYCAIIAGAVGSGKSTLARTEAKYCCDWFDESYIAFTDDEFIKITNNCPEFSSVVLDESFVSLNSRITMSGAFVRIINHLQIIRQKHLFIFLCLPNFFDLSKGVAIFRANHLFVTYATAIGDRGRFAAFGKDEKRELYVKGNKFMNYNAVKANFIGRFTMNDDIIPEKVYEKMKLTHLLAQQEVVAKIDPKKQRNVEIFYLRHEKKWKINEIAKFKGLNASTVGKICLKPPKNT